MSFLKKIEKVLKSLLRKRLMYLCAAMSILSSCNTNDQYIHIPVEIVPAEEKKELFERKNFCIVYYFDGNCSFCYSNVLAIENSCPDSIGKMYVYYGEDTLSINFNLEKLKIEKEKLFYDTNNLFRNCNKTLFPNNVFIIDSTCSVVKSAEFFDEELINEIQNNFKK
ncbi:MAG: hypothetical protein JEZ14_14170 [Marinilabiliaceae bacterium]|nr:hypothetical protein [Marinilabiliaceae bacterium]